ncbi:Fic family protein [Legionella sp. D16C41]|uniref:Fic family protein n=1 Tax=Legionella sp. D16C41 TaxID=3402688 RepID=UPI003AF7E486
MTTEVKIRLYRSMLDLGLRLIAGERNCTDYYHSLCFQLNYLFLNIKKNNQLFILDETGQQTIDCLLNNLSKQIIRFPPWFRAKEDFTFFYFHLLRSWLYVIKGNFDKAEESLIVAKTFPEKTRCTETNHLGHLVQKQIELQKEIQQIYLQQSKLTTQKEILPSNLDLMVKEYQSNQAVLLLDTTDEILARYFIDLTQQAQTNDPIGLWNQIEPGSVQAMIKLVRTIFAKNNELSTDFIKEMHKLALTDVILPQANRSLAIIPGEFRKEPIRFGMLIDNTSLLGLYDILDWVEKENITNNGRHRAGYNIIASAYLDSFILEIYTQPHEIEKKLTELIDNYYSDITNASSKVDPAREVIKACATFSHYFSLTHPFSDGNLRLSQQLLNFLLAKNNLPLCILSDPALIEGLSPDELVEHIVIGFHNFKQLIVKGCSSTAKEIDSTECDKDTSSTLSSLINQSIFKYQIPDKTDIKNSLESSKSLDYRGLAGG